MTQLEQAGYVAVRKGYVGKRPRTWLRLSKTGRAAYAAHTDVLRAIAGDTLASPAQGPRLKSAAARS